MGEFPARIFGGVTAKHILAGLVVGLVLLAVVLLLGTSAGCATTGRRVSMGCVDPLDADCDDPAAYKSLTAILPPWPFPKLMKPMEDNR